MSRFAPPRPRRGERRLRALGPSCAHRGLDEVGHDGDAHAEVVARRGQRLEAVERDRNPPRAELELGQRDRRRAGEQAQAPGERVLERRGRVRPALLLVTAEGGDAGEDPAVAGLDVHLPGGPGELEPLAGAHLGGRDTPEARRGEGRAPEGDRKVGHGAPLARRRRPARSYSASTWTASSR